MSRAVEADDSGGDAATLIRAGGNGERRPGLRAAGLAGSRIAAPIVARHGGGALSRLKADWAAIIGPDLADSTWPAALGRGGALKLIVASARAIEVQHRVPFVIDRINLFLGRAVVARLALVQGVLPLAPASRGPPAPALAAGEAAALDHQLADIADPDLRDALAGLGRAVLARRQG